MSFVFGGLSGFDMAFRTFGILFSVVFVLVIGLFILMAAKGISTWNKNNNSPRLTATATIVAKRTSVSHHRHAVNGDITSAHGHHITSSTWYYVTFQVESGDRIEFSVTGSEYGMLAKGDIGKLSFQGTRYLSFTRS